MNSNFHKKHQPSDSDLAVYDCEISIKFRLIEEKGALRDRDRLIELLLDAFSYGEDEYLEAVQAQAEVKEVSETEASPTMRRQLIRLRNSHS
jgi:Npun R1517